MSPHRNTSPTRQMTEYTEVDFELYLEFAPNCTGATGGRTYIYVRQPDVIPAYSRFLTEVPQETRGTLGPHFEPNPQLMLTYDLHVRVQPSHPDPNVKLMRIANPNEWEVRLYDGFEMGFFYF